MKSEQNKTPELDLALLDRIQFLVDNELTQTERLQLFAELDKSNNGWKTCAIAFCDDQFIRSELEQGRSAKADGCSKNQAPTLSTSDNKHGFASYMVVAASLLIGLFIGISATNRNPTTVADQVESMGDAPNSLPSVVESARSLARADRQIKSNPVELPYTRLFELENTKDYVVYVSPDPLPEFILQSMIFAGHEVNVTRETIESKVVGDRTMKIPVYEMRVDKNQLYSHVSMTDNL